MISNKGLVSINTFMNSCDDLINGKFLFAENKVANILKAINESPELYEVISECLKDFNYEKEFGRAKIKLPTKKGTFKMPDEYTSKIALVFCMLVEIQEGKINLIQFLSDYFDTDEEASQFENFASEVIIPFKNAIAYLFDIEGGNRFKEDKEEAEEKKVEPKKQSESSRVVSFVDDVNEICEDILNDIEIIKIKEEHYEDVVYLTNSIKDAVEKSNFKVANALIIGLCYVLKQVKKLRFYERLLRDAMENLYLD